MSFFGEIKESLIRRALSPLLGSEFKINFKFPGDVIFISSGFERVHCYVVGTDDGLFCIEKAEVVVALRWESILYIKKETAGSNTVCATTVLVDQEVSGLSPFKLEFPYSNYDKINFEFRNNEFADNLFYQWKEAKASADLPELNLLLLGNWLKYDINLPIEKGAYIHNFSSDTPRDQIDYNYELLGKHNETLRILLFIGRMICEDKFPAKLFGKSFDEAVAAAFAVGIQFTPEFIQLYKQISQLSSSHLNYEQRGFILNVAEVETLPNEWQSPIHTDKRFVVIGQQAALWGINEVILWNDFHRGTQAQIIEKQKIENETILETSIGKIYIRD